MVVIWFNDEKYVSIVDNVMSIINYFVLNIANLFNSFRIKNGSKSKKSLQDANNEQQQQRSTGSLKDKLRIPRPKSHSMGEAMQQRDQYKSSNQQNHLLTINDRDFGANNNEMTSLTRKSDGNAASINVAPSRGVVKAGSSNDIGRATRVAPGSSSLEVGVRRGVNVYTPPGVPIVD